MIKMEKEKALSEEVIELEHDTQFANFLAGDRFLRVGKVNHAVERLKERLRDLWDGKEVVKVIDEIFGDLK